MSDGRTETDELRAKVENLLTILGVHQQEIERLRRANGALRSRLDLISGGMGEPGSDGNR